MRIQGFTGVYIGVHRNTGYTGDNIAIYGMCYNPGDYTVGDYM